MLRVAKLAALVSVVVLVNAVTTLLFVQAKVPAVAQVPAPCVDGDVNGDTSLDISDPVYLLQHLFEGGPAPVACAQALSGIELELALDAALGKFFPRVGDAWESGFVSLSAQQEQVLFTVPPGKVFELEFIWGRQEGYQAIELTLELRRNNEVLNSLADYHVGAPSDSGPRLLFEAGDQLIVRHAGPLGSVNREVWMTGQLYDAP